jgi:hypothetical protein
MGRTTQQHTIILHFYCIDTTGTNNLKAVKVVTNKREVKIMSKEF